MLLVDDEVEGDSVQLEIVGVVGEEEITLQVRNLLVMAQAAGGPNRSGAVLIGIDWAALGAKDFVKTQLLDVGLFLVVQIPDERTLQESSSGGDEDGWPYLGPLER
ncbi:hypothetical protein D9M68_885740 [compost metagenome]